MKKVITLLVPVVVFIGGCATGYHKNGFTGGYQDIKIQEDVFKVGFSGNAYCSSERAAIFALLRCAEVTLENGYKYFVIIDEKSSTKIGAYTTPTTAQTYGTVDVYAGSGYAHGTYSGTTNFSGGDTFYFSKPAKVNTIKCFKEKPENIPTIVYDAEQVKNNIRKQYNLK